MARIKNFIRLKATTVALLCFVSGAFAQNVTLTMKDPGNSDFLGIFTSPYTLTDQNGFDISAFCITFSQDVEIGQQWEAEVKTLADQPYNFGLYVQAYLAIQLTLETNALQRALLSFAIWGAYDIEKGATGSEAALSHLEASGYRDEVELLIGLAGIAVAEQVAGGTLSFDPANVAIYRPTGALNTCPNGPCSEDSPQVFMTVKTPEPPVLTQLGLDLFAFAAVAALVIRGRKGPSLGQSAYSKGGN